ncbi:MAG: helix-turn-helix domain-containing protein [Polyangiaceae bacterium]|nr:helix-turn-helix domain-containing protein [Polyangiaceae bacterium]
MTWSSVRSAGRRGDRRGPVRTGPSTRRTPRIPTTTSGSWTRARPVGGRSSTGRSGCSGDRRPSPPDLGNRRTNDLAVGHEGLEPSASGLGVGEGASAGGSSELQGGEIVRKRTNGRVQRSQRFAANHSRLVASLLHGAAGLRGSKRPEKYGEGSGGGAPGEGVRLFTVKEVAATLRVCTATVYSMVERGELEHVRVSNAIRIVAHCPREAEPW